MRPLRAIPALVLCGALGLVGCSAAGPGPGTGAGADTTSPSRDEAAREPAGGDRAPRTSGAGPLAPALEGEPSPPATPRQAVARIRAAERAIGDPATPPRVLAAAGHTQQLAYRELAARPGWDERVLAALPRDLRRLARDNVAARRAFRSMHPTRPADLATELPAWRIVEPLPAARLRQLYQRAERRYGVDWEYLAAINMVETVFGRIKGTSSAGAQGPMQFIPTTWDIYGQGGDVRDERDAIPAAARLLRANGFAEDPAGALLRYNNHPAYVRGVTLHAEVIERRPRAFLGYHAWQVHYLTRRGSVWLPEGYAEQRPVPVREWLARQRG